MGSVSGWTEGILLTLSFLAIFGIVIGAMNIQYNKHYSAGLTDSSGSEQLFIDYQSTAENQIQGGDVVFDADTGITLKNSYGLAKDAISISWGFISGGFIEKLANAWGVGESGLLIARFLRILYFLSLVFALLYALFKVAL